MENLCPACDVDLPPLRSRGQRRKWCSDACRVWAINHPGEKRVRGRRCTACGADIGHMQYKAKFCSKRCNQVARGKVRAQPLLDVACAICSTLFAPVAVDAKYCSEGCRNKRPRAKLKRNYATDGARARYHRRRALKRGTATEGRILRSDIGARDGWRCAICHKKIDPDLPYPDPQSPSIDHIVPLSQSGPHIPANVRVVHLICNTIRSNKGGNEQLALV